MHPTRYFSPIHASKESQLAGAMVEVADSDAIAELRAALLDYPEDYNLLLQLAQALGNQLRYREAITQLTRAIRLQPENPIAYRKRAPRYFSTLQFSEAYADYSFCKEKSPGSLDILYRLGILCLAMGRYEEGKQYMASCIPLTQQDGEMRIAVLYWYLAAYLHSHAVGEVNLAVQAYDDKLEVGHHFAYKAGVELLCGAIAPEELLGRIDDSVDDLDYSMMMYGLYLYRLERGEAEEGGAALEALLKRDYYWAGFAYVVASQEAGERAAATEVQGTGEPPWAVPKPLYHYFLQHPAAAVAFSGGVDSSYLLYAAKASGCRVAAYYVSSPFQPRFELEDARRMAKQLDIPLRVLPLDVLANETVRANPPDRCYHCKRAIFGVLLDAAAADGFTLLLDGTNASDDAGDRPGMRALAELAVQSPLRQAGVTKGELREYSRQAGLFSWNKPAYACLATRIPTGTPLEREQLERVERGESLLAGLGYTDFRLRLLGTAAKLQLPKAQLERLLQQREAVFQALSGDFTDILLDLKPRA